MIQYRELAREEIPLLWQIDRREVIEHVYYLRDGRLVLEAEHYDMQGWPPGEAERYTPLLYECFARRGLFYGACEGTVLQGMMVLDNKFIGRAHDQLQLKMLHVSRDLRGQGVGVHLFDLAVAHARQCGAKKLYISATPSENTIHFYLRRGCTLAEEVDAELFALEPEDIHLTYDIIRYIGWE